MNLGDEAILEVIIAELRRRLPVDITVFSLDPADTLTRHPVEQAVPVRQMPRTELVAAIQALDLFILGGGGILFDGEAANFLRPVQIAQELGVPVMTWAIGVGPLQDRDERATVQQTLNQSNLITVRDLRSKLLLEEVGVTRDVLVTADPGLLLEPDPFTPDMLASEGIKPGSRLIGLSVREPGPAAPDLYVEHYHDLLANTVDYLVERLEATALFIPMEQRQDLQQSHAIAARVANVQHTHILKSSYTSRQIRGLVAHLEFVIGMRLHFLIFTALAGVPFVPLSYGSKVAEFISELTMPMPPVQATNAGQLLAYIDHAWDYREALRQRIATHLPALVERAAHTAELAVRLVQSTAAPNHSAS
jgi:polysaccharide pyruvyl transferase CsaB